MITLQFEYGATNATPRTLEDEWFQITYKTIRDSRDFEIATYIDGFWQIKGSQEKYSDIIVGSAL